MDFCHSFRFNPYICDIGKDNLFAKGEIFCENNFKDQERYYLIQQKGEGIYGRDARFFTARAEGYDQHMLEEVEGCSEGYSRMAQALPELLQDILDVGCGTGLELELIFQPGFLICK